MLTLVTAWLFGGATRFDVLAPLGATIIGLCAIGLFWVTRRDARMGALEKLAWISLFAIPLLQLVPLPPPIWKSLPTHTFPERLFGQLGLDGWLSWSLTPSRTLSSLTGFVPALAVYLWSKGLSERHEIGLFVALAAFAGTSSLLGLLQIAGGPSTPLRLYEITNRDAAVGFFSNANHFGVTMAATLPLIVYLSLRLSHPVRRGGRLRLLAGFGIAALVTLGVLASLSRAAWLVGMGAWLLIGSHLIFASAWSNRRKFAVTGTALVILVAFFAWLGANGTLSKLAEADRVGERTRLSFVPEFIAIARDTAPLGSGLGSFDATYRAYEDPESMSAAYLNNAHNDLAQVAIEAGVPGLIAIALWLSLIAHIFILGLGSARRKGFASLAGLRWASLVFGCLAILAHSLIDYPLRGAAASAIFALFLALLWPNSGEVNNDAR
ncbi:MAG: O-antigen ligase family protein [Sphingomonadaceae bacterium]